MYILQHTEHCASYVINLPKFKCQNAEKFGKKTLPGGQQWLNICHEHYFRCQNTIKLQRLALSICRTTCQIAAGSLSCLDTKHFGIKHKVY